MRLKKFLIILTASAISLAFAAGCKQTAEFPELAKSGSEDTVTVYVLTHYELTGIEVNYEKYSSWKQLIEGEFDDSNASRSAAVWRGEYVVSIGNLRPYDPGEISLYLNGVRSSYFVKNCKYRAGYALAFVENGATMP